MINFKGIQENNINTKTTTNNKMSEEIIIVNDQLTAVYEPTVFTPLMKAVFSKNLEQVKELSNPETVNVKNNRGQSSLHLACSYSNSKTKEIIKVLLENKADPNLREEGGFTPLMLAVSTTIDSVEMLLKNGANPNLINKYGGTALMLASYYSTLSSSVEIVECLLKNGADPNLSPDLKTALFFAKTALFFAKNNYFGKESTETVEMLLKHGAREYSDDDSDDEE